MSKRQALRGKWADLAPRTGSAVIMILVAGFAIWMGGFWFLALVTLGCGAMLYELRDMMAARLRAGHDWAIFGSFSIAIILAGISFITLRKGGDGFLAIVWVISVVVATDIAGYFGGKIIGGPKFWPRISPKKTWAGTGSGWIAAALVGAGVALTLQVEGAQVDTVLVVAFSIGLSLASQLGDIAESALKRRYGVKDSSNLIPGHGGVLDRFDGLVGVGVVLSALLALAFVVRILA